MCFMWLATVQRGEELCLVTSHSEQECVQERDMDAGLKERLKTIEPAAMVAIVREEQPAPSPARQPQKETCRKWNIPGCSCPQ